MNARAFRLNYLPVLMAVLAAAIVSAVWYSPFLFGKQWIALRSLNAAAIPDTKIAAWKPVVEIVREFVVAYVLLRFVRGMAIDKWRSALNLGFWVWMGFPVAMLVGASLWDNKPWALTLIHAGDWFTKMLVMAVVITLTRGVGAAVHDKQLNSRDAENGYVQPAVAGSSSVLDK